MVKQTKLWNGKSDVLLNLIRETCVSNEYKEAVPEIHYTGNAEADVATIHEIGNIITSNNSYTETFYNALYGVIGAQIIAGWYYTNKYKNFKKGVMQIGDVIQIARPKTFKGTSVPKEVENRNGSDVDAPNRHGTTTQFFARNLVCRYKDTIDRDELKRAFASISSFDGFVSAKLQFVYNMYEVDEQLTFKYLTLTAINQNNAPAIEYTKISNSAEATAKNIIKAVKNTCGLMTYPKSTYNLAQVMNSVQDRKNLNIIMPVNVYTDISVDALAGAFNMSELEMKQKLYEIDSFTLEDDEAVRLACIGVIPYVTTEPEDYDEDDDNYIVDTNEEGQTIYIDREDVPTIDEDEPVACVIFADDFYQIYDNVFEMYTRMNESGLFQNYFLHVWQTWAVSMFAQFAVVKQSP